MEGLLSLSEKSAPLLFFLSDTSWSVSLSRMELKVPAKASSFFEYLIQCLFFFLQLHGHNFLSHRGPKLTQVCSFVRFIVPAGVAARDVTTRAVFFWSSPNVAHFDDAVNPGGSGVEEGGGAQQARVRECVGSRGGRRASSGAIKDRNWPKIEGETVCCTTSTEVLRGVNGIAPLSVKLRPFCPSIHPSSSFSWNAPSSHMENYRQLDR